MLIWLNYFNNISQVNEYGNSVLKGSVFLSELIP
jgi:hypothetical protein